MTGQPGAPALHALVIGAGGYPNLQSGALAGTERGARALADWLLKDFVNPTTPAAVVEILSSPDGEPPTADRLAKALDTWLEAANSHPGNIALFYFSGHAIADPTSGDQLLIPDDAHAERLGRVISVSDIVQRLNACAAERQIVLIDAGWTTAPAAGFEVVARRSRSQGREGPLSRGVFRAASAGKQAYATVGDAGYFSRALLNVLQQPSTSPLSLGRLANALRDQVEVLASGAVDQPLSVELAGDFDFHFPEGSILDADAPRQAAAGEHGATTTPQEAADEPPAKAARKRTKAAPPRPRAKRSAASKKGSESSTAEAGLLPQPEAVPPAPRPDLEFYDDDAELDADALRRAPLAVMLARRLHKIWSELNRDADRHRGENRASFVVHLDAPWGGGKTTFANFVARVLNPYGFGEAPARFLSERCAPGADLSAAFAQEPEEKRDLPDHANRPWIIVPLNAWRMEHCNPPWWAFYQAMRQACFRAIRVEGDELVKVGGTRKARWKTWFGRYLRWTYLWARELLWRLFTPKLVVPFIGLLLFAGTLAAMMSQGWVSIVEEKGQGKSVFDPGTPTGALLLGLTGLTTIGGLISLVVESLAPGINPLAERLGLGHSDPLERFRRHFQNTMQRIRRPVLVVVDDLDRCKPEVIVDLVRGMQTLMRSSRVMFMILGDRDWIERAFEAKNAKMAKVGGGAEQSLGARFVEKAIQMSFLLPGMGEDQSSYVDGLLQRRAGRGAAKAQAEPDPVAQANAARAQAELRRKVRDRATERGGGAFDAERLRQEARDDWEEAKKYMREAREILKGRGADGDAEAAVRRQVAQIVNEELAIQAATTAEVEAEAAHRLRPLARWLPSNPRQIKRILNGVALYHAVALNHPTFKTEGERRLQLALWVVVMTEWPMTWRLLVSCPALADVIAAADPAKTLEDLKNVALPGSSEATLLEISRIRADAALLVLLTGRPQVGKDPVREGPVLDAAAVEALLAITPPHGRPVRLADPPPKAAAA